MYTIMTSNDLYFHVIKTMDETIPFAIFMVPIERWKERKYLCDEFKVKSLVLEEQFIKANINPAAVAEAIYGVLHYSDDLTSFSVTAELITNGFQQDEEFSHFVIHDCADLIGNTFNNENYVPPATEEEEPYVEEDGVDENGVLLQDGVLSYAGITEHDQQFKDRAYMYSKMSVKDIEEELEELIQLKNNPLAVQHLHLLIAVRKRDAKK